MKSFILFLITLTAFNSFSQELTQTVRGTVKDKETLEPIIGAKMCISTIFQNHFTLKLWLLCRLN